MPNQAKDTVYDENDDYDSLDELEEDDQDPNSFHTGPALQPPEAKSYSTEVLHAMIHEGQINLDPPYQRAVVWNEKKQSQLIASIYRNFYVPPILFAISKDVDGNEELVCVDGKQRLTSIQKFFDGQISYRDPVTKKTWWYTRPARMSQRRLEVPEHEKKNFRTKRITCVLYRGLSKNQERDLFKRVQEGVPLTTAEKMQAVASPRAYWIQELDSKFLGEDDGLQQYMDFGTKRGLSFQLLAQLVFCCHSYPERTSLTPSKMEVFLACEAPLEESFMRDVSEALRSMYFIASQTGLNMPFQIIKQRVAPAEFVFIGLLLYLTPKHTYEFRSSEILGLRKYIRSRFTDIRRRKDVFNDLWAYIDVLMQRLKQNGRSTNSGSTSVPYQAKSKKTKRDDQDYRDEGQTSKKAKK